MGKVTVAVTVESLGDLYQVDRGEIGMDEVRRIEIPDAVADIEVTHLSLPVRMIQELGLTSLRSRSLRTVDGPRIVEVYGAVRLTILGREFTSDVIALRDDSRAVIGRISLHALDLVVDPIGQTVTGNPAHGGEHISEFY